MKEVEYTLENGEKITTKEHSNMSFDFTVENQEGEITRVKESNRLDNTDTKSHKRNSKSSNKKI